MICASKKFGDKRERASGATLISFLLKQGAETHHKDDDGCNLLHYMCKFNICIDIQCLIDNGADINAINNYGRTPIMECAYNAKYDKNEIEDRQERERIILKRNPDCLNTKSKEGSTPIMECAFYAKNEPEKDKREREITILFLLEQGAEIHHKDRWVNDLLHFCKKNGLQNAENMLLEMQKIN